MSKWTSWIQEVAAERVCSIGTIHVAWDCGSTLGVAYGVDFCTVMKSEGVKRDD